MKRTVSDLCPLVKTHVRFDADHFYGQLSVAEMRLVLCRNAPEMGIAMPPIDKEATFLEIERVVEARGLHLSTVAVAVGLGRDTLTKARQRGSTPSLENIQLVLDYLKIGPVVEKEQPPTAAVHTLRGSISPAPGRKLPASMTKDLPVMGTVAGSVPDNGFEITEQVVQYVDRPPGLRGVLDAYAIYVVGESMFPAHPAKSLCLVHPYRPYHPGDSIVIQLRETETAPIEGYIKTFIRETPDELVVSQYNPPMEIRIEKRKIVKVEKVMTLAELL